MVPSFSQILSCCVIIYNNIIVIGVCMQDLFQGAGGAFALSLGIDLPPLLEINFPYIM